MKPRTPPAYVKLNMQVFIFTFFAHVVFIYLFFKCLPVKPEWWCRGLLCHCIVLNPSRTLRTARDEGETTHLCELVVAFRSHVPIQGEPSRDGAVLKLGILLLLKTRSREDSALTQKETCTVISSSLRQTFFVSSLVTEMFLSVFSEWKYDLHLCDLMQQDKRLVYER